MSPPRSVVRRSLPVDHPTSVAFLDESGSIAREELTTVLADDYSTPPDVKFEIDVREEVNRRLERLGIVSICRLSSLASDGLQLVDLLTSAVCFEFRQSAGLAGVGNSKADLAVFVREKSGVDSFLKGYRDQRFNVAQYTEPLASEAE